MKALRLDIDTLPDWEYPLDSLLKASPVPAVHVVSESEPESARSCGYTWDNDDFNDDFPREIDCETRYMCSGDMVERVKKLGVLLQENEDIVMATEKKMGASVNAELESILLEFSNIIEVFRLTSWIINAEPYTLCDPFPT